jgi:hypothetical protein
MGITGMMSGTDDECAHCANEDMCTWPVGDCKAPTRPMRYDIATDSTVPVTQEDWDQLATFVHKMKQANSALSIPDEASSKPFKFQLAAFPNPMHLGYVFIAEAKAIEPYGGLRFGGEDLFPPVPKTPWVIGGVEQEFALEIVRRWNRVPGQY